MIVRPAFIAALFLSTAVLAHSGSPGAQIVTVRGRQQVVHHYPPTAAPLNRKVLFVPGVRGFHGWAIDIAQTMASWGYDVYGLDTKVYLVGSTGKETRLTESDVMEDFRELAQSTTNRSGERVILVGWSEGAGLGVLAAAAEHNRDVFAGLIAFGLGDENAIATMRTSRPTKRKNWST